MPADNPRNRVIRRLRLALLLAGVVATLVVINGLVTRAAERRELARWTEAHAMPHVSLARPRPEQGEVALELPGRLQAYAHAPIRARISGYLRNWQVDIGARVEAGQLLGEVDTPDLDQQLLQARADLALAQANAGLSATTAARWEAMLKTNAVARQAVDEKLGDLASKRAQVKAAQAAVDRLVAMKEFARIVAPFDGTVTARSAEIGALVNAGTDSGPALFEISDTRRLRLYVAVPQVYAASIVVGSPAEVTVPEHPGIGYRARVESMSGAVDPASGATLVQLLIDNAAGELLPGGFASVRLALPAAEGVFSIPASALIFDQAGLRVATVDAENVVRLKSVAVARDLGRSVEISSGLTPEDRVIENPPDGIAEGTRVAPAAGGG